MINRDYINTQVMIIREINCNIVDGHNRNSILVLFIKLN